MDDELLREFLTESGEHLESVETQLVQFERDPTDASLVSSIFRLVHTIKGTSSFLGLDRLQAVAHAAETLIGDLRDGVPPTQKAVSLILAAIDRIKAIIGEIEVRGAEPEGDDAELIAELEANVAANLNAAAEPQHVGAQPEKLAADTAPETDSDPHTDAEEQHARPAAAPVHVHGEDVGSAVMPGWVHGEAFRAPNTVALAWSPVSNTLAFIYTNYVRGAENGDVDAQPGARSHDPSRIERHLTGGR